jgi:hypothetical protein
MAARKRRKRNTHLMQRFGVAFFRRAFVGQQLTQAGPGNQCEGAAGARAPLNSGS